MKVLILSCSTGQGHNSAAFALKEEFERKNVICTVADPVLFQSRRAQHFVSSLYNGMIRRAPSAFAVIYKAGKLYDSTGVKSPVYAANSVYSKQLYRYIRDNDYDAVVATHLYGMEALTAAKRRYGLDIPAYGVLTDYTMIPFIAETDLSGYFVPTKDIADQLINRGCDPKSVFSTGIPVSKRFCTNIEKAKARKSLNIPQDKKVIVVMSGGVGSVKLMRLCGALNREADDDCAIYALTGKSKKIFDRIRSKYGNGGKVTPVPFTKHVDLYLKAADVLLSKPGGLSSTEAAVSGVPLVHVDAIPGCETENAKLFENLGMSVNAKNGETAVDAAMKLLSDRETADRLIEMQRKHINPGAADSIVRLVTGS